MTGGLLGGNGDDRELQAPPNGLRDLSGDWQRIYAHPIYFVETFIDPQRFRGTCYRAANWTVLGETTGRGKDDMTKRPNRPIKQVLGLPLVKDYRQRLSQLAA